MKVEKGEVLSREEVFSKETNLAKVIEVEGEQFSVNEIVVVLKVETTLSDVQNIANAVNGRIAGLIPIPLILKLEVPSVTVAELDTMISKLQEQHNPPILFIVKNLAGDLR